MRRWKNAGIANECRYRDMRVHWHKIAIRQIHQTEMRNSTNSAANKWVCLKSRQRFRSRIRPPNWNRLSYFVYDQNAIVVFFVVWSGLKCHALDGADCTRVCTPNYLLNGWKIEFFDLLTINRRLLRANRLTWKFIWAILCVRCAQCMHVMLS